MENIRVIERAFDILKVIAAETTGVGLTEIANQVDLPKSTVARILSSLEKNVEAVERTPDDKGYRIGPGILALTARVPYPQLLNAVAQPHLLELVDATGEAAALCLPDGDQVYVNEQIQGQHQIQVRDWTGERLPAHVNSAGKIFLAYWPAKTLERYLARPLERFTANTVTLPDQLRRQLAEIREHDYTWVFDEYEEGLGGVAAPIRDKTEKVIAAVNLYGPTFRFPPKGKKDQISQLVINTSIKITKQIGGAVSPEH